MRKKVINIIRHPLFSGSAVMIVGTNLNNVLNYLFHLFMGRMLGPAAYGEMASLFSLIILVSTIPSSISLAIIKFISSSRDSRSLSNFFSFVFVWSTLIGGAIFLVVLFSSSFISSFLKLSSVIPVILLSISFLFLLPSIVLKSALQGLVKFNSFVINILVESGTKLLFGILFVWIGWSVTGSIAGILVSAFIGLIIGFLLTIRHLRLVIPEQVKIRAFFNYSVPILIYSVAGTSLFSADLLLVKHFFSSYDAGTYAALSTMGKIILFGAGPVSGVMFPLVSQRHSAQEKYEKIFWYSFLLTAFISLSVLLVYWAAPQFAVSLLYGHKYLQVAHLLFPFGIFVSLLTLSSFLIGFFLSVNYLKIIIFPVLAAIMQIIGIYLFHLSLSMVINVSIFISASMFIALLCTLRVKTVKIRA